jgi:hypothetical protein
MNINRVGTAIFARWFTENGISLGSKGNLFDVLEEALQNDTISLLHVKQAIAELEESGNKKIILLNVPNSATVEEDRSSLLSKWKRSFGLSLSSDDWVTGTPGITPSIINLVWHDGVIKIKYVERQFEIIVDPEADTVQRMPKTVCVVLIVDTTDGLAQIRLDTPYQLHSHRNDENKPSDRAYEQFYPGQTHLNFT